MIQHSFLFVLRNLHDFFAWQLIYHDHLQQQTMFFWLFLFWLLSIQRQTILWIALTKNKFLPTLLATANQNDKKNI